ncbi:MAG TPA: nuclear transport factor 2 family protein [Candidatus Limnocylindrales bacterium]|nr:nuclear transport factor 2 family protein [Candidatus Limnocylindrales bacterium]
MDGGGGVTPDSVTRWLDAHDAAWRSAEHAAIAELFSEDAVYHLGPFEEPWRGLDGPFRGRDAIAAGWLAGGIEGERFDVASEILAIDGFRAVVRRRITYFEADGSVDSRWDTCWVLDFDREGRCSEYREWFVEGQAIAG